MDTLLDTVNITIDDIQLSDDDDYISHVNMPDQNLFNDFQRICFIASYSTVFFFSLVGNIVILLTIYKKRKLTVNNLFLVNITISNLLYTLNAPFPFIIEISENNGEWIFPGILCPILPFLKKLSVNLNTLTLTVSSVDRLLAITCPLKTKLSKKGCYIIITLVWLISVVVALPWMLLMRIQPNEFLILEAERSNNEALTKTYNGCIPSEDYVDIIRIYFLILNIIQYVLPVLALTITYSIITYYIRFVNARNIQSDENKSNNVVRKKNEKKLFKMQVFMLICFNVCWLPFQLNSFLFVLNPKDYEKLSTPYLSKVFWMISHLFSFFHFCFNPYITGIFNDIFRREIKQLIMCRKSTCQQNQTFPHTNHKQNRPSNVTLHVNKNGKVSHKITQLTNIGSVNPLRKSSIPTHSMYFNCEHKMRHSI